MKVLVRGEIKEKTYQATCRKCISQLEFTKDDGTISSDRNELVLKVCCPVCKNYIFVGV